MATEKNINNFIVNKVENRAVYDWMVEHGHVNEDELYLVGSPSYEWTPVCEHFIVEEGSNLSTIRFTEDINHMPLSFSAFSIRVNTPSGVTSTAGGIQLIGNSDSAQTNYIHWNASNFYNPGYCLKLVSTGYESIKMWHTVYAFTSGFYASAGHTASGAPNLESDGRIKIPATGIMLFTNSTSSFVPVGTDISIYVK